MSGFSDLNKNHVSEMEAYYQERIKQLREDKDEAARKLFHFEGKVSKWEKRQQHSGESKPKNSLQEIALTMCLAPMLFLGFLGVFEISIGDLSNILVISEDGLWAINGDSISLLPQSLIAIAASACINVGERLSVERHAEAFLKTYGNYGFYDSLILQKIVYAVASCINEVAKNNGQDQAIREAIETVAKDWIKRLNLMTSDMKAPSEDERNPYPRKLFWLGREYVGPPFYISVCIVGFETIFASYGIIKEMDPRLMDSDYFWLICIAILIGACLASFVNVSLAWGFAQKRVEWEMVNLYSNRTYAYKAAGNIGRAETKDAWMQYLQDEIEFSKKELLALRGERSSSGRTRLLRTPWWKWIQKKFLRERSLPTNA